jgi:hypothetical protein
VQTAGQFQVERQWRFEVGKGLGHQGNAVEALAGQALKFKFCDHVSHLFMI